MGFLSRLNKMNPFSTYGTIGSCAYAYQAKYPQLSFREALEISLVRGRIGWDEQRLKNLKPLLDGATTADEMIEIIVMADRQGLGKG